MSKSSIVCIFALLTAGYLGYDRYVSYPKELILSSEKMLSQIAIKEKWFNALDVMDNVSKGDATYNKKVDTAYEENSEIKAFGKIEYISQSMTLCKWVDFNFKPGTLNDYKINSQYNCSDR